MWGVTVGLPYLLESQSLIQGDWNRSQHWGFTTCQLPFSVWISVSSFTKEVGRNYRYHRLQKVTQSFTADKGKSEVFPLSLLPTEPGVHFTLLSFIFFCSFKSNRNRLFLMQVIWKASPGCSSDLHSGAAPTVLLRDPPAPPARLQVTNRMGHETFPPPAPVLRLFISSSSTQSRERIHGDPSEWHPCRPERFLQEQMGVYMYLSIFSPSAWHKRK